MAANIAEFKAYSLEEAKRVAQRCANILHDTFMVLQRNSDGAYIVASKFHPGETKHVQTLRWDGSR